MTKEQLTKLIDYIDTKIEESISQREEEIINTITELMEDMKSSILEDLMDNSIDNDDFDDDDGFYDNDGYEDEDYGEDEIIEQRNNTRQRLREQMERNIDESDWDNLGTFSTKNPPPIQHSNINLGVSDPSLMFGDAPNIDKKTGIQTHNSSILDVKDPNLTSFLNKDYSHLVKRK